MRQHWPVSIALPLWLEYFLFEYRRCSLLFFETILPLEPGCIKYGRVRLRYTFFSSVSDLLFQSKVRNPHFRTSSTWCSYYFVLCLSPTAAFTIHTFILNFPIFKIIRDKDVLFVHVVNKIILLFPFIEGLLIHDLSSHHNDFLIETFLFNNVTKEEVLYFPDRVRILSTHTIL